MIFAQNSTQVPTIVQIFLNDVKLVANQKNKIKSEIALDPAGMGYAAMSQADACVALCTPYSKPNPNAQGTIQLRTRGEALRKLKRQGVITDAQLIAMETDQVPDPAWVPIIEYPSRIDAILGTVHAVISLAEYQNALV